MSIIFNNPEVSSYLASLDNGYGPCQRKDTLYLIKWLVSFRAIYLSGSWIGWLDGNTRIQSLLNITKNPHTHKKNKISSIPNKIISPLKLKAVSHIWCMMHVGVLMDFYLQI